MKYVKMTYIVNDNRSKGYCLNYMKKILNNGLLHIVSNYFNDLVEVVLKYYALYTKLNYL